MLQAETGGMQIMLRSNRALCCHFKAQSQLQTKKWQKINEDNEMGLNVRTGYGWLFERACEKPS